MSTIALMSVYLLCKFRPLQAWLRDWSIALVGQAAHRWCVERALSGRRLLGWAPLAEIAAMEFSGRASAAIVFPEDPTCGAHLRRWKEHGNGTRFGKHQPRIARITRM